MINNLPEIELFAPGHRGCAGCAQAIAVRTVMKAAGKNTIVANATGCLEVFSTPYPQTAWRVPWVHAAFETAASVASGIDEALKKQKKRKKVNLLAFAGDGGTFDIGMQALSGAFERGQRFCYVCFDNNAYMNTGIQRSGATPKYAATTTSPAGKKIPGKMHFKKDMPFIVAAHGAYVATANIAYPHDVYEKVKKALEFKGPSYIQIFVPCPPGWKIPSEMSIEVAKLAFNCKITPLFEIENGVVKITRKPGNVKPVKEFLEKQGRFKHLNEKEIEDVQKHVDSYWERIVALEESGIKVF